MWRKVQREEVRSRRRRRRTKRAEGRAWRTVPHSTHPAQRTGRSRDSLLQRGRAETATCERSGLHMGQRAGLVCVECSLLRVLVQWVQVDRGAGGSGGPAAGACTRSERGSRPAWLRGSTRPAAGGKERGGGQEGGRGEGEVRSAAHRMAGMLQLCGWDCSGPVCPCCACPCRAVNGRQRRAAHMVVSATALGEGYRGGCRSSVHGACVWLR